MNDSVIASQNILRTDLFDAFTFSADLVFRACFLFPFIVDADGFFRIAGTFGFIRAADFRKACAGFGIASELACFDQGVVAASVAVIALAYDFRFALIRVFGNAFGGIGGEYIARAAFIYADVILSASGGDRICGNEFGAVVEYWLFAIALFNGGTLAFEGTESIIRQGVAAEPRIS